MKKLLLTIFATALLTGCGAQPAQESASKTSVEPREPANPRTREPANPRTRDPSASATSAGGNTRKTHRPGTASAGC